MQSDWITGHVSILNAFAAVCINKTNVIHVAYVDVCLDSVTTKHKFTQQELQQLPNVQH